MGSRKHNSAEARKEAKKTTYVAKLVDVRANRIKYLQL